MYKKWTDEENERIRTMRAQGCTYKEMVPYFPDRTLRSLSVQANKILAPSKVLKAWTPEEEQQLIDLRLAQVPYKEIAKILGRSYSAVKTKGSYITETIYDRNSGKIPMQQRVEIATEELTKDQFEYIETGQEFFRF